MPSSSHGSEERTVPLRAKLQQACAKASPENVQELLAKTKLENILDQDLLRSCLKSASRVGAASNVRLLLQYGANPRPGSGKGGEPAIWWAVTSPQTPGHIEVLRMLLDFPFEEYKPDLEWQDEGGRPVLFSAAWKGHLEALEILVDRRANINVLDKRDRTILHNLAADPKRRWDNRVVDLVLKHLANIDHVDSEERTALHWATATGKDDLVERLLTLPIGKKPNVNLPTSRNKTVLHLACVTSTPNPNLVNTLLRHNADPILRSDGNWTCLHNTTQSQNSVEIVRSILQQCPALLNATTSAGLTALHYAAWGGKKDVVSVFLEYPDLKIDLKDTFHTTPLLRAAQAGHASVVEQLAPFNNTDRLSENAKTACDLFEATIVDFRRGSDHRQNNRQRCKVYDALYSKSTDGEQYITTLTSKVIGMQGVSKSKKQGESKAQKAESRPLFRWIHLPANNIAWAEALVTKSFMENDIFSDIEGLKAVIRAFSHRHHGAFSHSNFMRPITMRSSANTQSHLTVTNDRRTSEALSGNLSSKSRQTSEAVLEPLESAGHTVFYMPYLHFETMESYRRMKKVVDSPAQTPPQRKNPNVLRDESLIKAYLESGDLHLRRTLDQSYLHGIDTQKRDEDQVVTRWCKKNERGQKLFMVDQLWMCILGSNLVMTAFPQRWNQSKNEPLDVLDGVIEDINSKTRPPIENAYDLALLITSRVAGAFDRHKPDSIDYQFLDMFESSIGAIDHTSTMLYDAFYEASADVQSWLNRDLSYMNKSNRRGTLTGSIRYPDNINNFLDLDVETQLLKEIKDIRDELNMISMVLNQQLSNLPRLGQALSEDQAQSDQREIKKKIDEQKALVETHINDVNRMSRLAGTIEKSLLSLLDLKQKQANAFEARLARDQASGTVRQGRVLLIFTI